MSRTDSSLPHLVLVTGNPVRTGGMQKFTRDLVRAALADGWRVTIALSGEDIYSDLSGAADERLSVDRVDWIDANRAGDRPFKAAVILDRYRWFRRTAPDVVLFVQSSNTPFRASVAGACLARVPVVTTQRTMPAVIPYVPSRRHLFGLLPGLGLHRRLLVAKTWLTSMMARCIVYNSHAVRRGYEADYHYPVRKGCVIPNAVETPPLLQSVTPGPIRIGFVGRLGREKRLDVLLRAVAALPSATGIRIAIHGEGPERCTLERLACELGISDRVSWCGTTSDVWAAYADLDIVVLCSPRESSSNMILEAMAAGKAVIVSEVGGMPELVGHGRAGVCVPPLDVAALTAAIERLVRDAALRRSLGAAAAAVAAADHAPRGVASAWMSVLRRAARPRPRTDVSPLACDAGGPLAAASRSSS